MADDIGIDGFAGQIEAIIGRADSRPTLRITCPTLVIVGADDLLIPPEHGNEMAAASRAPSRR